METVNKDDNSGMKLIPTDFRVLSVGYVCPILTTKVDTLSPFTVEGG